MEEPELNSEHSVILNGVDLKNTPDENLNNSTTQAKVTFPHQLPEKLPSDLVSEQQITENQNHVSSVVVSDSQSYVFPTVSDIPQSNGHINQVHSHISISSNQYNSFSSQRSLSNSHFDIQNQTNQATAQPKIHQLQVFSNQKEELSQQNEQISEFFFPLSHSKHSGPINEITNGQNVTVNLPITQNANLQISQNLNLPISQNANFSISQNVNLPVSQNLNLPISQNVNLPISQNVNLPISQNIMQLPVSNGIHLPKINSQQQIPAIYSQKTPQKPNYLLKDVNSSVSQQLYNTHISVEATSSQAQMPFSAGQTHFVKSPTNFLNQRALSAENQQIKESVEPKRSAEAEDLSDNDMEVKSLDLAQKKLEQNLIKNEGEKERPMSWEGELTTENQSNDLQDTEMRVDIIDEPMSPMSPMSPCLQSDLEKPQLKCAEKAEEKKDCVVPLHTAHPPPATSPCPARSDSGCELHLGPFTPTQSPLMSRIHMRNHSPTHFYSPTQSPGQSRHLSGFSSPYSQSPSTGLSRNNSDASQYGSYNSYSSAPSPISPILYSPSQSPNLNRVIGVPYPVGSIFPSRLDLRDPQTHHIVPHDLLGSAGYDFTKELKEEDKLAADLAQHSVLTQSGITRQQLINSPCPICGDKISGFHYGIFSCESCKGFFKRTVQNKKHYVCMRGSSCPVAITTRKKCPACRFDKCLRKGMKLEAIREDRTRGGRSTYQCAPYALSSMISPHSTAVGSIENRSSENGSVKLEPLNEEELSKPGSSRSFKPPVPEILQKIWDVEHLWHCSVAPSPTPKKARTEEERKVREAEAAIKDKTGMDYSMCEMADGRLYKIVKWCKSLPLFKDISIDDQITLLMNSWCELLLLSCCFRSIEFPGEIRVSSGKRMTLPQAQSMGIGPCIERMLNLSYHLRRLKVDHYEYMAMKVIVLLTSDVTGLQEGEKVRESQEKVVRALQEYTLSQYPHVPSKFGELLLRIPELQRTCHASQEMLSVKKKEGDLTSFYFLFELLRGDDH